jgi:hypothetical protein
MLNQLRKYAVARDLIDPEHQVLVQLVQDRRNAIHAFKDRPIGNEAEFSRAVLSYLDLLRNVNGRLPYPDDFYVSQKT